jgi:hypothetical protein
MKVRDMRGRLMKISIQPSLFLSHGFEYQQSFMVSAVQAALWELSRGWLLSGLTVPPLRGVMSFH